MKLFKSTLIIGGAKPISINAATHRLTSIAKLFTDFSEKVSLLCIFEGEEKGRIFGFDYLTYKYPRSFISWIKFTLSAKQLIKTINKIPDLDCLVINQSIPSLPTIKIAKFCKKHGIKFVFDIGEWYEKSKWLSIKGFIKNIDTLIRMKKICHKFHNYLVASTMLFKYIHNRSNNVLILPTIVDERFNVKIEERQKNFLRLCFCGVVEKDINKENLNPLIEAVDEINGISKHKIVFDIVGVNGESTQFKYFYGPKPYLFCLSKICSSDFIVIPRDHCRKNDSGFPTKLSEAFTYCVPVITTDTGDISKYVINGVNGFVLKNNSKENFVNLFIELIEMLVTNETAFYQIKRNVTQNNKLKLDCFKNDFSLFVKNLK